MQGMRIMINFLLPIITLLERELVRFFRQKSRVIGAFATPLIFWALLGSGMGSSFSYPASIAAKSHHANAGGYLAYFFPGTVAMILLFTSIFSNISLIQDRNEGFLQSVMVAPIPRTSLVLGKLLGGTTIAVLQGGIFLLFSPLIGIHLTFYSVLLSLISMFIVSFALSALGFSFAWKLNSIQGFHSIMNLMLFPMWLLSGAVFPISGASSWVSFFMQINPLTYGVAALRESLTQINFNFPALALELGIMAIFALIAFFASVIVVTRPNTKGI